MSEAAARGESLGPVATVPGILTAETVPAQGAGASPDDPARLETLVAQIPAGIRETLDELFRAKFIAVRSYPRESGA